MFPRSTHETFAQKLYTTFKNNKRFAKPKLSRTDFTVVHYAGDVSLLHKMICIFLYKNVCILCYQLEDFLSRTQVTYQADQFLDKNKDYVVAEHQDLLNASSCPFVASLFPPLPQETAKSSKFSSIGSRFKVRNYFSLLLIQTSYFVAHILINFFSSVISNLSIFLEASVIQFSHENYMHLTTFLALEEHLVPQLKDDIHVALTSIHAWSSLLLTRV